MTSLVAEVAREIARDLLEGTSASDYRGGVAACKDSLDQDIACFALLRSALSFLDCECTGQRVLLSTCHQRVSNLTLISAAIARRPGTGASDQIQLAAAIPILSHREYHLQLHLQLQLLDA